MVENLSGLCEEKSVSPAMSLSQEEIRMLVERLREKNHQIRYQSLLLLQERSRLTGDVYPYWYSFCQRLEDRNSFQRNIGILLLSENVKWDAEMRFDSVVDQLLARCRDEKFITCRQAIQSISKWLSYRPDLSGRVRDTLLAIPIDSFPESQQKLILMDIVFVLTEIQKIQPDDETFRYLSDAITGGLLERKVMNRLQEELK